jgi:hypothetical protein
MIDLAGSHWPRVPARGIAMVTFPRAYSHAERAISSFHNGPVAAILKSRGEALRLEITSALNLSALE